MSRTIPCSARREIVLAFVDDDDWLRLRGFSWHLTNGYPSRKEQGKNVYMHHDVIGKPEVGFITDHRNRSKLDNRKENLRHITQSENIFNSDRSQQAKYIYKHRRRFQVKLRVNGNNVFVGSYASYVEAEVALKEFQESLSQP